MNESTVDPIFFSFLKSSHRSRAEQAVGFGIVALSAIAFAGLGAYLIPLHREWVESLKQAPWSLSFDSYPPISSVVYGISSLSFWTLWRRHSLLTLKLELALFVSVFLLGAIWSFSLFGLRSLLLSLVSSLMWMSSGICCAALFWKKEPSTRIFILPLLIWIFYNVSVNMVLCIANP